MTYDRLKKAILALVLTAAFMVSMGVANTSVASVQYRERRWGWQERGRWQDQSVRACSEYGVSIAIGN